MNRNSSAVYGIMAAMALIGTACYTGCSEDADDGIDSQRMSLAERRMTRGAESSGPQKPTYKEPENKGDSVVVYEDFDTAEIRHYGTLDYEVSIKCSGGLANTVKVSAEVNIVAVPDKCTAQIWVEDAFYHNGGAMVYFVLKFRQFNRDFRYDGEYFHPLPYHYEVLSER